MTDMKKTGATASFSIRQFLLILIVFFTMTTLLAVPAAIYLEERRVASVIETGLHHLHSVEDYVREEMNHVFGDIQAVVEMQTMQGPGKLSESVSQDVLERMFILMMNNNSNYRRLSYFDATGVEILRVGSVDGEAVVIPVNQRISQPEDSDHIFSSMELHSGDIHVSPMGLKEINGVIVRPLRPLLRFASPIDLQNGAHRGGVFIEYSALDLLTSIKKILSQNANTTGMLLNPDGYCLIGDKVDNQWGNLLGRHDLTFAAIYPDVWRVVVPQDHGSLVTESGLYLYQTMFLKRSSVEELHASLHEGSNVNLNVHSMDPEGSAYQWKLVSYISQEILTEGVLYLQPRNLFYILLFYLLQLLLAFLLSYSISRRQGEKMAILNTLAKREKEFRGYLESVPDGIIVSDGAGLIQRINSHVEELFGYERSELIGQPVKMLMPDKFKNADPAMRKDLLKRNAHRNRRVGIEIEGLRKNGTLFPLDVKIKRVETPEGRIAISTVRDITRLKQIEKSLREAKKTAEQASMLKTAFLANMSHEIRTPLNSVIGGTYLLARNQTLDDEVREEVNRISIAGQSLLAIINDILDLSKIEAGEFSLESIPMHLSGILDDIKAVTSLQADIRGIKLNIPQLPSNVSSQVIGDPIRIRQILLNLVNNAIKFTPEGSVSLVVERLDAPPRSAGQRELEWLRFTVSDTGAGISEDVLPKLFEPFKQAYTSTTRQFGGTGLGLTIVKQLCEKMGGHIAVESVLGSGSTFRVDLPLEIASDEELEQLGQLVKPLEVMIADDDAHQRETLNGICELLGWQTDVVSGTASLAQHIVERADKGKAIDCLLVSHQLPQMSNLEALSRINEKLGVENAPQMLLTTIIDAEHLRQLPHADLVSGVLSRPLQVANLFNDVNQAFMRRDGHHPQLLNSSQFESGLLKWLDGVRILLVDDSNMNINVASGILGREGAIITSRVNGAEALEWLTTPGNEVDIVLMDIQMPVMDGNTAVKEIRRVERLRDLPVVALSAEALLSERNNSIDAGMSGYLTKPFEPDKMVRTIREHVETHSASPIRVTLRDEEGSEVNNDWPQIDGLDGDAVKDRLQGDVHLFKALLQEFISDYQSYSEPLICPQEKSARDALKAEVHKFAGNAGLIGASTLFTIAKSAENQLADDEIVSFDAVFSQLSIEYSRVEQAAKAYLQG